jgi:hypothetical protein
VLVLVRSRVVTRVMRRSGVEDAVVATVVVSVYAVVGVAPGAVLSLAQVVVLLVREASRQLAPALPLQLWFWRAA